MTKEKEFVQSFVEYGINGFAQQQKGSFTHFIDRGWEKRWIFVHRVKMTDLVPDRK